MAIHGAMAAAALGLTNACRVEELDALHGSALDAGGAGAVETGPADATTNTASDGASEASAQACMSAGIPVLAWTFDTTDDSWILSSQDAEVTMSWSGAMGNPTPGGLEVDFTGPSPDASVPGATIWVHAEIPATDLTGRNVSAWVWLGSGSSPQFLSFAQTQTAYAWADNGELRLPQGAWTCVSLPISSPVDVDPPYDPTHVIRIGFEMIATVPFQLYIDSVRVE
jgi:hypothetical protein